MAVVGIGRLGRVLVDRIPDGFVVTALSRTGRKPTVAPRVGLETTSRLSDVSGSSVILLALPPEAIEPLLERMAPHVSAGSLLVNMATQKPTPGLGQYVPQGRVVSAKVIGQAAEIAQGSPALVLVDFATADEWDLLNNLLGPLGVLARGSEETVLAANSVVAEELVRATRKIRERLRGLDLPPSGVRVALSTMAVGMLRALASESAGPFLQSFVDDD